jgi:predicted RND superfamily exporter protein
MKHNLIEKIMLFGAIRPLLSGLIVLLLTLLSGYGLLGLTLDTDPDNMLNSNNPMWPVYRQVVKEFGSDNIVLIHYQNDDLFNAEKLKKIDEIAYQLKKLPIVEKVETLSTALNIRDNGFGLEITPLVNRYPETAAESVAIKNNALYSPLLKGQLISADGTKAAMLVTLKPTFFEAEFNRHAYLQIEQVIEPLRKDFKNVFQLGIPRLNNDFAVGVLKDLQIITPLNIAVLMLSLILMLRVFWVCFIPLITSFISIVWAFGALGYLGIPVNLLIAVVPALIIVIGSTEDTHMIAAYLQGLRKDQTGQRLPAIRYMVSHVGLPIFITSFTTIIGFLSNVMTDMVLIRDFSIASSLAMLATVLSTFILVPLLLNLFGPKYAKASADAENSTGWLSGFIKFVEQAIEHQQRWIIWLTTLIVLIFAGFALQITATNDPLSYFKSTDRVITDNKTVHQDLAGMQNFFITVDAAHHTDFKDPQELKKLDLIQQTLHKQGDYDQISSIVDYLKLIHQEMHQGDKKFYTLPKSRELIEQYLMLFQRSDLERVFSADGRRANFIVRHNLYDSNLLNPKIAQLQTEIKQILGDDNHFSITGKNLMANEAADLLFASQGYSLLATIVVFCLVMIFLYSSVTAGLVSMIPNLIPILVMFGTMGLLAIPLNSTTALVAVIALGIAIDDTIHIFSTYNREVRVDGDQNAAATRSIKAEAVAVTATSFSLAAGFITLSFSSFSCLNQFGFLAALTMLVAMLTELLITPVILKKVRLVGLWDVIGLDLDKQALTQSAVFADMTPFQIKRVILLSKIREYQPGEIVIQQGETGSELFLILSGQVDVVYQNETGEKLIASLNWSHSFGEAGYAANVTRTATVRVSSQNEPLRVVVLNQEQVESAMRFYPRLHSKLNHNISKILARMLSGHNTMEN